MAGFSQSQGFKGKSELKANPPSESMKFSMLLFCALVLITLLFGLTQALALFFLPPNSNGLLPSHLSWLYFVFSSVLFVLYIHHVISLLEGNSSEQENSSFLLFHSYLNLFVDIAFLTYAFCLPLEFDIALIALFVTVLLRIAICYIFTRFTKCTMVIK